MIPLADDNFDRTVETLSLKAATVLWSNPGQDACLGKSLVTHGIKTLCCRCYADAHCRSKKC